VCGPSAFGTVGAGGSSSAGAYDGSGFGAGRAIAAPLLNSHLGQPSKRVDMRITILAFVPPCPLAGRWIASSALWISVRSRRAPSGSTQCRIAPRVRAELWRQWRSGGKRSHPSVRNWGTSGWLQGPAWERPAGLVFAEKLAALQGW